MEANKPARERAPNNSWPHLAQISQHQESEDSAAIYSKSQEKITINLKWNLNREFFTNASSPKELVKDIIQKKKKENYLGKQSLRCENYVKFINSGTNVNKYWM